MDTHAQGALSSVDVTPDIGSVFAALIKKKFVLAAVTVLFGILGYFYASYIAVPVFEAKALLIRDGNQPNASMAESFAPNFTADLYGLNTEVEILYSYPLLARVVDGLVLNEDPEFTASRNFLQILGAWFGLKIVDDRFSHDNAKQNAVITLQNKLAIRNIPSSVIFEVALATQNAEKSQKIVNYLVDLYIQDQMEVKFEAARSSAVWLTERVADLEQELQIAERAVTAFSTLNDPVDRETLDTFTAELLVIRAKIKGLTGQDKLRRLSAATDREERLAAVKEIGGDRQLEQLALRLGGVTGGPIARAFDTRFRQILDELERAQNIDFTQLEDLRASENRLVDLIEDYTQTLLRLEQLERIATSSRLTYEFFLGRLKESHIQNGIQQPDTRILSYAVIPISAKSPNIAAIILLFKFIGFTITACVIFLYSKEANRFKSIKQLEDQLDLKVTAELPFHRGSLPGKNKRSRRTIESPAYIEGVNNLLISLDLTPRSNQCQIITVTSSMPGEGKTTVAVTLAKGLAINGHNVILIDSDLRKTKPQMDLLGHFDKKRGDIDIGLSEVLTSDFDIWSAIQRDEKSELDYIISKRSHEHSKVVLRRSDLQRLVEYLSSRYDYIVFDTPPLNIFYDAFIPISLSNIVYFNVFAKNMLKTDILKNIQNITKRHNVPCEVIVLDDHKKRQMTYKDYT